MLKKPGTIIGMKSDLQNSEKEKRDTRNHKKHNIETNNLIITHEIDQKHHSNEPLNIDGENGSDVRKIRTAQVLCSNISHV